MKVRHWITAIVLLALIAAAVIGFLRTREAQVVEEGTATEGKKLLRAKAQVAPRPLVDQRPLQTARRLSAAAGTPEEQALGHQAEKIADHEVDLAFFDAIRTAEQNPPPLSPQAKQISERKAKAEQTLKEDQESITLLTRKLATAPESQKDNLQDQIDVAKAQMDLDQDELDDASEDLEQAGGDPQSKIKRLQAEHEAGDHNVAAAGSAVDPHEQDYSAHTLLKVAGAWQALRQKIAALDQARQEAADKEAYLIKRHTELAAQVEKDRENREAARQQAKGFSQGITLATREESKASADAALASLKQYTLDQRLLADRGRRMQDEEELQEIYANWIGIIEGR